MRDLIQYKRTKLQLIQKQISNYHYESILTVTKRFIDLYENNNPAELYEILSLDVKYIVPDSWDELFNPTGFDHDLLGISKVAKKISSSIWLNKEWIKDSIPYYEFGHLDLPHGLYPCAKQTKRCRIPVLDILIFETNQGKKISQIERYSFHQKELQKIFVAEKRGVSYAKH